MRPQRIAVPKLISSAAVSLRTRFSNVIASLFVSVALSLCVFLGAVRKLEGQDRIRLFQIFENRRFGFINNLGQTVIPPEFLEVYDFHEGLAVVFKCGKYGYINTTAQIVISARFDAASDFSEGLARVTVKDKVGYINSSGGIVVPPHFDKGSDFSEGRAEVWLGGKSGYIDQGGLLVVPAQYDQTLGFFEGLAAVEVHGLWGFIDRQGRMVIPPQFKSVSPFGEERASAITVDGEHQIIDPKGRVIARGLILALGFAEGLAPTTSAVEPASKWGYVDRDGRVRIPLRFDAAYAFSGGLARVRLGAKWGFIDKTGNFRISPRFEEGDDFSEGVAGVKSVGKWGFIDRDGKFTIAPRFLSIGPFTDGVAFAEVSSSQSCYINRQGAPIWCAPSSQWPRFESDPLHGISQSEIDANCQSLGGAGGPADRWLPAASSSPRPLR